MSHTSSQIYLKLKISLKSSNLLFSSLLMSSASSITFYKWMAEFNDNFINFSAFFISGLSKERIESKIILRIGIIELRGALSSCATDEKNVALIFFSLISIYLTRVMSVQNAIKWLFSFIKEVLT